MEIAKFVLTCAGSFIAVSSFFLGFWKSYKKKVDDKIIRAHEDADKRIEEVKEVAEAEIDAVREGSIAKTEKLERRIAALERNVTELQRDVNANLGQRLASIEGTMKGMSNILGQIQGYFISHTSAGDK